MMLYEEGKIMLDDPVGKYIPEFAKPEGPINLTPKTACVTTRWQSAKLPYGIYSAICRDSITVLLRAIHTKAGTPDAFTIQNIKIGDVVKKLTKLPLNHQSGEKWTYGSSIDVLDYWVEVVSGMPLDQFFQKQIFEPLGRFKTLYV